MRRDPLSNLGAVALIETTAGIQSPSLASARRVVPNGQLQFFSRCEGIVMRRTIGPGLAPARREMQSPDPLGLRLVISATLP